MHVCILLHSTASTNWYVQRCWSDYLEEKNRGRVYLNPTNNGRVL